MNQFINSARDYDIYNQLEDNKEKKKVPPSDTKKVFVVCFFIVRAVVLEKIVFKSFFPLFVLNFSRNTYTFYQNIK